MDSKRKKNLRLRYVGTVRNFRLILRTMPEWSKDLTVEDYGKDLERRAS